MFKLARLFKKTEDDNELEVVDLPWMEVFSVGLWNGDRYTITDLEAMVESFGRVGFQPVLKVGHEKKQEDPAVSQRAFGAPALGFAQELKIEGGKLLAKFTGVPKKLSKLLGKSYKRVSAEIFWDYVDGATGITYPKVLKAVALLGDAIPAVTNLKEIEALYQKNEAGVLLAYDDDKREFRTYELEGDFCDMGMGMPKKAKSKVNYTISNGNSSKNCGSCRYSQMYNNACGLVEGTIERGHTCDMFEGPLDYSEATPPVKEEVKTEAEPIKEEFTEKTTQNPGGENMDKDLELAAAKEALEKTQKEYSDAQAALKQQEDALATAKAAADKVAAENSALSARMEKYEKELTEQKEARRLDAIKSKVNGLKVAGKIAPAWETQLVAVFSYLPDNAVHTYSDEQGKEQKVAIADALYSIFEKNASLFSEQSKQDPEETSTDAVTSFNAEVKAFMDKNPSVEMRDAVKAVTKAKPELYNEYDKAIKKSN